MFDSRTADCGLFGRRRSLGTCSRIVILVVWLASVRIAAAQESPGPSATPEQSPAPSISPVESGLPSPITEQTPSVTPGRSIRISFVPPPLEGRISLGIYDTTGKLVRILHQEAQLNQFQIGADALVSQWDGRNSEGMDLPPGKYHARGYMVGSLKVEDLNQAGTPPPENNPSASVRVKLMPNPLDKDKRAIVELAAGFDSNASYLKTIDELPLLRVSESPNLIRVLIMKKGDKSVDLWQDNGAGFHQVRVSNVDQMMAFDCGAFELK
jgi:hypothetical protein